MAHEDKKKVSEVYENPYFGKKKNNTAGSATWDSSHVYGFGKKKKKFITGSGAGTKGGFGAVKRRKKLQHGGRTNLLEELGRVEAEPSNRNRRAEISRVHRELNKGYKSGGAVLKGKKVGIQIK